MILVLLHEHLHNNDIVVVDSLHASINSPSVGTSTRYGIQNVRPCSLSEFAPADSNDLMLLVKKICLCPMIDT